MLRTNLESRGSVKYRWTKKLADRTAELIEKGASAEDILAGQIKAFKARDAGFDPSLYHVDPSFSVAMFRQSPLFDAFGVMGVETGTYGVSYRTATADGWANLYGDVEQAPNLAMNAKMINTGKVALQISYDHKRTEADRDRRSGVDTLAAKGAAARQILKNAVLRVNLRGLVGYGVSGSNVHGILTSPLLAPVFPAVNPGAGSAWGNKTNLQVADDIMSAITRVVSRGNLTMSTAAYNALQVVVALPSTQLQRVMTQSVYRNGNAGDLTIEKYVQQSFPQVSFVQVDELKDVTFLPGGTTDMMLVMVASVAGLDTVSTGSMNTVDFAMSEMFAERPVDVLHNGGVECHKVVADTFGAILRRPDLIERVSGI